MTFSLRPSSGSERPLIAASVGPYGAMLGNGAQTIHGRSAEPPLQTLEQSLRALCERLGLEQIGVLTLERSEYAALHSQSHGRDR